MGPPRARQTPVWLHSRGHFEAVSFPTAPIPSFCLAIQPHSGLPSALHDRLPAVQPSWPGTVPVPGNDSSMCFRSPEAHFASRDPPPGPSLRGRPPSAAPIPPPRGVTCQPSSILRPPMARTRTWRRPIRLHTFKLEPDFASGLLERTDVDLPVQSHNALKS